MTEAPDCVQDQHCRPRRQLTTAIISCPRRSRTCNDSILDLQLEDSLGCTKHRKPSKAGGKPFTGSFSVSHRFISRPGASLALPNPSTSNPQLDRQQFRKRWRHGSASSHSWDRATGLQSGQPASSPGSRPPVTAVASRL